MKIKQTNKTTKKKGGTSPPKLKPLKDTTTRRRIPLMKRDARINHM
jgi:hypothetical protein